MPQLVPPSFLFRYSIPMHRFEPGGGDPLKSLPLSAGYRLPHPAAMNGEPTFGDVRLGWSEAGLALTAEVSGKRESYVCNPHDPGGSDGLQIWLDTRNTQNVHRATRFCHSFCLLPQGGGARGTEPVVCPVTLARGGTQTKPTKPQDVKIAADLRDDGYRLDAWIPADVLTGYDPGANPRLGFYYRLQDAEAGEQCLSVGRDFPFSYDPSVWSTLELID